MRPGKDYKSADLTEKQIERYYVQQILSGKLPPGTRLPSNRELAEQWSTSCSTIQKAIAGVAALGLLDRKKYSGTYVRGGGQRSVIGVLFGPDLTEASASHYRVLASVISTEINSDFLYSRIYDNIASFDSNQRDYVLQNLLIDQKFHSYRAFIEIFSQPRGKKLDEYVPGKYPRVIYDTQRSDNDFLFDYNDFARQILIALRERGCRDIWYLKTGPHAGKDPDIAGIRGAAAALGMKEPQILDIGRHRPGRFVEVDTDVFLSGLLAGKRKLPDAIVLSDDIATRGAIFALLRNGIKVPDEVIVATLGNEAVDVYYSVPVIVYNFPTVQLGKEIVKLLWQRIAGKVAVPTPIILKGHLNTTL